MMPAKKYTPEALARRAEEREVTEEEVSLVRRIAVLTAARWPRRHCDQAIDHDDLLGEALAAGWRALLTHDPAKGALTTWLVAACRGAVLEALRRADPLSRKERAHFRESTVDDPSASPPRRFYSIEWLLEEDEENGQQPHIARWWEVLSSEDEETLSLPERLETAELVERALYAVHDREREVIRHCVMGERTLKGQGFLMGICESRVKQIKDQALARMRLALGVTP
jgi:RNA polymerase sigma factor (sigma-70 family)